MKNRFSRGSCATVAMEVPRGGKMNYRAEKVCGARFRPAAARICCMVMCHVVRDVVPAAGRRCDLRVCGFASQRAYRIFCSNAHAVPRLRD